MTPRGLPLVLALLALACATASETLSELGLPTRAGDAEILETVRHGGYLVSTLQGERYTLSFMFPASPRCAMVLQVPGRVGYTRVGRVGDLQRGATTCPANGIASIEAWRDRAARFEVRPSEDPARYRSVFVDGDVTLLRGSFPQLSWIGWHPTRDAVVMLPRNPACDAVAGAGQGELRFHETGFPAFTLSVDDSHCAVIGVADPV